jgi:hypothetical protein
MPVAPLRSEPLAPCHHVITLALRDEVYQLIRDWARAERQPVEVIIAEILAANVGLG